MQVSASLMFYVLFLLSFKFPQHYFVEIPDFLLCVKVISKTSQ